MINARIFKLFKLIEQFDTHPLEFTFFHQINIDRHDKDIRSQTESHSINKSNQSVPNSDTN